MLDLSWNGFGSSSDQEVSAGACVVVCCGVLWCGVVWCVSTYTRMNRVRIVSLTSPLVRFLGGIDRWPSGHKSVSYPPIHSRVQAVRTLSSVLVINTSITHLDMSHNQLDLEVKTAWLWRFR